MAKTAKKAPAKKAPAKKAAAKAKTAKPKMTAKPSAKVVSHATFMWKMLEKKEQKRKSLLEQQQQSKFNMHRIENQTADNTQGFTRFNGPRRKAA